jgi:hypothetical protein
VSRHLRGRFLFAVRASYWHMTARFDAGAVVKPTNLTEAFDFQTFKQRYKDQIPLFLIGEKGKLTTFTVLDPPEPDASYRVLAIVNPLDESELSPAPNVVSS